MSIIVKGIEMPESCDVCMFGDWSNLSQTASCKLKDYEPCFADFSVEYISKRADFCPLIALPDKHGRLVDADALEKEGWSLHRTIRVDKNTEEYQTKPLRQVPTIEPQRKKGKWINHRCDDGHHIADCDQCGHSLQWFDDDTPKYCCECGAKMEGEG